MKQILPITLIAFLLIGLIVFFVPEVQEFSGAPPYGESEESAKDAKTPAWYVNWKRPDGPTKVALQVGHWKNDELPEELDSLIGNTGATGRGISEAEVNLAIAKEVEQRLLKRNIKVEILPATVPSEYWADVFIAIHADGNVDRSKTGYKIAGPWRDLTGNGNELIKTLNENYELVTGLPFDDNISRNMRGYYAFAWWRYQHAIHPMTTAAIVETGFLTGTSDQDMLIDNPEIPAEGIANGIIEYLESKGLVY